MHIQPDRAFVPVGYRATRYLSVVISAPPAAAQRAAPPRPGVDVALVLDRSGSMAGRKFDLAREAVAHAIRLLGPDDRLSVVVYDDEIETVLERTPATPDARREALARLARVDARGATNLSEGWFTGARSLGATLAGVTEPRAAELPFSGTPGTKAVREDAPGTTGDRIRRVLLLTDGLANRGTTDRESLCAAAAALRQQGVGTSTFGVGDDFDEELLAALAAQGGGHFYFIDQPQQIPDVFASELGEVLDVVARDVVFEVTATPGVGVGLLNPLPVEPDGAVTRVRLGDLVRDQDVRLLVSVEIEPRSAGETASVLCRVRDRGGVLVPAPLQIDWTAVTGEEDAGQPVSQAVLAEVARMVAEVARVQALAANRRGDFEEARLLLQRGADCIARLGLTDALAERLARELLREQASFASHMAAREMKARHFASYAAAHSRPGGKANKRRA